MFRCLLLLVLLLLIASCERRTVVGIEGGNPPTFVLSGSGKLGVAIVFGPEQERIPDPFDKTYALWEIVPEKEGSPLYVGELHNITYGVVPRGYKQIKPTTNQAPPLKPNTRYRYWFITVNAPHAAGYFEIRDGKAVAIAGP